VFFFRVCVVCASRSPGATEKSTQRKDELYIERVRPLAENSKQNVTNSAEFYKKSTQIGEFSTQLSPKNLHNFKKDFSPLPCDPPPKQSVQIWPTLPRDFPKRLLEFLPTPYATHLGNILCANLADFHHNFLA
jgi:hypothetical protein